MPSHHSLRSRSSSRAKARRGRRSPQKSPKEKQARKSDRLFIAKFSYEGVRSGLHVEGDFSVLVSAATAKAAADRVSAAVSDFDSSNLGVLPSSGKIFADGLIEVRGGLRQGLVFSLNESTNPGAELTIKLDAISPDKSAKIVNHSVPRQDRREPMFLILP